MLFHLNLEKTSILTPGFLFQDYEFQRHAYIRPIIQKLFACHFYDYSKDALFRQT